MGSGGTAYQYDSTGTAWTFSGAAGITGNSSGFTRGNPNAPEGSQVAFIQETGTISQAVNFAAAGSYLISLNAAQRGNYGASYETFQVLVDGKLVYTITAGGTDYSNFMTAPFVVTAGSHTISFVGIDPSRKDYSAFIDDVTLVEVSPNGFSDPSFEGPAVGSGSSAYQIDPTGTEWNFSGGASITANGSSFTSGNSNAPEGNQVAFIEENGTISQTVNVGAGIYQISVDAAQRANYIASQEELEVLVDGKVVNTFTPSSTTYTTYASAALKLTAGSHTISFVGVDPSGTDYTAFLDQATLVQIG
jgi:hypothetical protein